MASQIVIRFIHRSHQLTFACLGLQCIYRYQIWYEGRNCVQDMHIYICTLYLYIYKRDFDIHAKLQISVCMYIIYVNVLIFICIHFTTSIFFYVPHDPQSLLPQPNHWHIHASTVPRSDGLRLFSAPSKEFGTPMKGMAEDNEGVATVHNYSKWRTAAKFGPKSLTSVFCFFSVGD